MGQSRTLEEEDEEDSVGDGATGSGYGGVRG